MLRLLAFTAAVLALAAACGIRAADLELSETLQLPESHSLNWVRADAGVRGQTNAEPILDGAKWGTPAPGQLVEWHWDWKLTDDEWRGNPVPRIVR